MPFQSQIKLTDYLTFADWLVFGLVLLLTLTSVLIGHWLKAKKHLETERPQLLDLLIMGRQLTLPLFVGTLVATWYGGIFGVTEIAFNKGIYNFLTQGVFWYISYIIFAFFLIDRIHRYRALTLPNLIHQMFGPLSARISALFNFFNVLPIAYTISLGLFLKVFLGGTLLENMFYGILIVILYSTMGGFRAVVFSDLAQFFVMCTGVVLALGFAIQTFGGLSFLKANLPDTHFHPLSDVGLSTTLVWGLIALSTLVDPNFYQRCFAAKSSTVAKRGILISTLIWFLFDLCTTFGAMYARAVIPEATAGEAYLTFVIQILPPGLRGFFLAGILATILSTLDSYLFLAGTTLSFDMLPEKLKGSVSLHHLSIVFVGALSLSLAYIFEGNIKSVWKTLGSYSASCLLLPVLVGHFTQQKSTQIQDREFVMACLLGLISTTTWQFFPKSGFWQQVDILYVGVFTTGGYLGLLYLHKWSLLRRAKDT